MKNNQRGFSLMELMVAATVTVGLMGVIFAISNRSQRVFGTESGVIDMNQNMRTVMDLLNRDVQSAGSGMPWGTENFPAVFYSAGASGAPDALLLMNGEAFAPTTDMVSRNTATSTFTVRVPPDITPAPVAGTAALYSYVGNNGATRTIYRTYNATTDPRMYLVYDGDRIATFRLTANAEAINSGGVTNLRLTYDASTANYYSPSTTFSTAVGGTVVGTGQPDYLANPCRISVLGSAVAYRLDTATQELLRTEDLVNWYPIARGVLDFQLQFRVVRLTAGGTVEEKVSTTPGDGTDTSPSGELTKRRDIHSVVVTIVAETPDVPPNNPRYRRTTSSFEITPRNLNLLNNSNVN
jgi:hypothetical protein